jgi:hypothetical protein
MSESQEDLFFDDFEQEEGSEGESGQDGFTDQEHHVEDDDKHQRILSHRSSCFTVINKSSLGDLQV